MNLSHFSNMDIDEVHTYDQPDFPTFKPNGFWVSVDGEDDWYSFCKGAELRDIDNQKKYNVILSAEANILHIKTPLDFIDFNAKHAVKNDRAAFDLCDGLKWDAVAKDYDGIIIAPYQWRFRNHMESFWYYTWDCASGCIWNARAVERLEIVNKTTQ